MRRHLIHLALCIASLACAALLGEVTVRGLQATGHLPDYASKPSQQAEQTTNPWNPKLRKSDNPLLHVEYDPADPRVNAFGMRGPLPALEKPANSYRIAVLGDSVGFGFGLPREQSFPYLLEQWLSQQSGKPVEVLNFSVIGYGLEAYNEVYRLRVRQFRPDMVLLAYVLNDMTPPANVFVVIKEVMKEQARLRKIAKVSQFAAWTIVTWHEAQKGLESDKSFTGLYADPATGDKLTQLLQSLHSATQADGATLLAFIFPYFSQLDDYPFTSVHTIVEHSMQQAGIPYVDLLGSFRGRAAESLQLQAGDITHPNAEGNRIAAEAMKAYILQQDILH